MAPENTVVSAVTATQPADYARRQSARTKLQRDLNNGLKFRFFLLLKMPIAWIAGMRLDRMDHQSCTASMPYRWLSQNPFRSIYFATQAMAAELSTGALAMAAITGTRPAVSMLITTMTAQYSKKATQRVTYTCNQGDAITEAVNRAIASGEGEEVTVESIGTMADGTEVSRFSFTWSFKARSV